MEKAEIRSAVWDQLEADGNARFPFPPHGRIPNFAGAKAAAERLSTIDWWDDASVIKANPDAPQRPVRERALAAEKTVLMAVPRLKTSAPFIALSGAQIDEPAKAATISHASEYGEPVTVGDIDRIDGIVTGCVAVDDNGHRIGKGEGYSDLEFAMLVQAGAVERSVPIATTVHDTQFRDGLLPRSEHDIAVDIIATPSTVVRALDRPPRPDGIDPDALSAEQLESIPVLETVIEQHTD